MDDMKTIITIIALTLSGVAVAQLPKTVAGMILVTDSLIEVEGVQYRVELVRDHPLGKQFFTKEGIRIVWKKGRALVIHFNEYKSREYRYEND